MAPNTTNPSDSKPASTPAAKQRKPKAADTATFFNRDLSWLEFNRRVLALAADEGLPLLERLRFVGIFTSNLDEFFMKRVGLVKRQVHAGIDAASPDGMRPRQVLAAIHSIAVEQQRAQAELVHGTLLPALARSGIHVLAWQDVSESDRALVHEWYRAHVFSALTPLAIDPAHRFPFISNMSDNLALAADPPIAREDGPGIDDPDAPVYARLKFPQGIRRYVPIPNHGKPDDGTQRFVLLRDVVRHYLAELFPGITLREVIGFRVTRSAGIQKDDLDAANLLQSVEADLRQRRFARVVRIEIDPGPSPDLLHWLRDKLNADSMDVYERASNLDMLALTELCDLDRPDLKFKPWKPITPHRLSNIGAERTAANFFAQVRKQDVLVHHPYESFHASVERFIAAAAADHDVLAIKQTLYRTSPDSPFIENLVRAAESGKQVACLVELRARFDEHRNVRFARRLEKAGVHVVYGVLGLKTHCKVSLVVRREARGLRCYAHLGTGNYHPRTAQQYTDVGLLTCDPEITADVVHLFNYLTGLSAAQSYPTLLVAPVTMRDRFNQLIAREIEMAKRGRPARIIAKLNSMEDRDIAQRLYEASRAGVAIDLICRGFCCLRPGVPGLSENIRVVSVLGRFLEHSRIFHFSGGLEDPLDGDWIISSADWMYRNLSNRVEAAVPVHDRDARARLKRIVDANLQDHRQAWDLGPDGVWTRRTPPEGAAADSPQACGTFEVMMREACEGWPHVE
jgi:polyphosphate kinase